MIKMKEIVSLNATSQKREKDVGGKKKNAEVWKGGAEENLLTRMRPCEICKSLIRRDCLFL